MQTHLLDAPLQSLQLLVAVSAARIVASTAPALKLCTESGDDLLSALQLHIIKRCLINLLSLRVPFSAKMAAASTQQETSVTGTDVARKYL